MKRQRFIDLESHAIEARRGPEFDALVGRCREGLSARGAYVLEGFLVPDGVARVLEELRGSLDHAYYKPKSHNAYLAPDDPNFDQEHPRNRKQTTTSATLAYDFVGRDSLLDRIYRWPPLRAFVAATLGYDALYPYDDDLAAVNVLNYRPGTQTGWHFDNAHFTVTLMLQQAEHGGAYEYVPFVRSPDEENYAAIETVLDGQSRDIHTLEQGPGDLVVFQGRYTLHRVTEVLGSLPRLVAVLSYDAAPGARLTPHTRKTFYGRYDAGESSPGAPA